MSGMLWVYQLPWTATAREVATRTEKIELHCGFGGHGWVHHGSNLMCCKNFERVVLEVCH
jgi:hypothetical protein